jgi:seryl-tRNA synthetase
VTAGFTPVLPPVLVREEAMYGTGFFPSEKNDYYAVPEDGLYLVGTSEVPLIAMHVGEILDELPLRYCAFSSCFRRESGSAGRDTRGMFRVHQFQKVEMVTYVHPDASWEEHERLLEVEESLVRELELPYRVVNSAAGDLSAAAAAYDIGHGSRRSRYRRSRLLNTTDFRRARASATVDEEALRRAHAERDSRHRPLGAAILENFDGEIPGVLQTLGAPARIRAGLTAIDLNADVGEGSTRSILSCSR